VQNQRVTVGTNDSGQQGFSEGQENVSRGKRPQHLQKLSARTAPANRGPRRLRLGLRRWFDRLTIAFTEAERRRHRKYGPVPPACIHAFDTAE
jgi:hypothetical protein